jgi:hypothetical protein
VSPLERRLKCVTFTVAHQAESRSMDFILEAKGHGRILRRGGHDMLRF